MSPLSAVLLLTIIFQASTLITACYIISLGPSSAGIERHWRRSRHNPSPHRFTSPHKSSSLPYRIRYARNAALLRRRRRLAVRNYHHRRYTYGIVPVMFDPNLSPVQRDIIQQTMSVFENFTCIRFVDRILENGQLARDVYRLGHNGYIEFVNSAECFCSAVGNTRTRTRVSCCRQTECHRLLGKALGHRSDQHIYGSNGFFRVNPSLFLPGRRTRYIDHFKLEDLDQFSIDLSRTINEDYEIDGSTAVALLTSDINTETGHFYFFKDISVTHQCQKNNCSNFKKNCSNDGYITLVDGHCMCRCPDGLNSMTGCTTVVSHPNHAVDCGNVFDLSKENPSVSFTSNQGRNSTCTWLVNAPENHTIVLDFNSFDIAKSFGECEDWLEIRYRRIGDIGRNHCGKEISESITSQFNSLLIRLFTSNRTEFHSSFSASAHLIYEQNLCYNSSDKGYTYAGTIDYARDYSPCVPWWQVTHCQHNPYRFQDMTARLDYNYCRNPSKSLRPWCYINPNRCQRKYCDVCMFEKPHNVLKDCYHIVNATYCTKDKRTARSTCAKECQRELFKPQENVTYITCEKPEVPVDGVQIDNLNRSRFYIGEFVTFRCSHFNRLYRTTFRKYCLTSGNWSHGNSACLPCHLDKGWVLHNESCYSIGIGKKSADDHQMKCRRHGGNLADIMSRNEQKFVSKLAFSKGIRKYFIGANDKHKEGKFLFKNFASVLWTNWDSESINGRGIDCVVVNVDGLWQHERCHQKYHAVCKAKILRHRRPTGRSCVDFREDCKSMADLDSKMCEREDGMFAATQCAKTCGVC